MKYIFLILSVISCSTPNVLEDKEENNSSQLYYDHVQKHLMKIENSKPVLNCIQAERSRIGDNIPENGKIKVKYVIDMNGFITEEDIKVIAEYPITMDFENCLKKILLKHEFDSPYDLKPFEGSFELDINPSQEKL